MVTKKQEINRVKKLLLSKTKKDKEMSSAIREFNFYKIKKAKLGRVK